MSSNVLNQFASQNGMKYDTKHLAVYGDYHGFQTIIQDLTSQKQYIIRLSVNGGTLEQQPEMISQFLQSRQHPYINYATCENSTVAVSVKVKNKHDIDNLTEILNEITDYFRSVGLVSCCKYCGAQADLGIYSVNRTCDAMCGSCFGKTKDNLSQAQLEIKQKKGNMLTGIVGALLGALLGGILWVIVYQIGFIAGIVGLVIAICAIKGYELLGGKLNGAGLAISLVIAVLVLFVAEYGSLTYQEYSGWVQVAAIQGMSNSFTFFDFLKSMPQYLVEYDELMRKLIMELAIGYVLMAVASVSTIYNYYKNKNLKHDIQRLA